MKPRAGKGLLLLLAATLVVVSTGCPNSTVITAGNGTVTLSVVMSNPTRFDLGAFNIDRILVRPVDPGANQAIGTARELTLLRTSLFVDTTKPMVDPSFLAPVRLSKGEYEIVEIRLSQIFFGDTDPTDPSTCESFQFFYQVFSPVTVSSFATPQIFTISDSQDTMLTLDFDLTQMMSTLNNAYTCSPGCGGWCISNFNAAQFAADTLDYLTIN